MAPAKILNVCNHRCFHLHCIGVFHCTSNYLRLQHLLDVLVGKLLEYGGEVDAAAAPPRLGWTGDRPWKRRRRRSQYGLDALGRRVAFGGSVTMVADGDEKAESDDLAGSATGQGLVSG